MDDSEKQLSLPLGADPIEEEQPASIEPVTARRSKRGFKRVTRDADVARSYSDNVALGYAVARGLAEVLTRMDPGELAALKARVAQSAAQTGRAPRARADLSGRLHES